MQLENTKQMIEELEEKNDQLHKENSSLKTDLGKKEAQVRGALGLAFCALTTHPVLPPLAWAVLVMKLEYCCGYRGS